MTIETTIWIYWAFCLMAMSLVITNRKFAYSLLAPNSDSSASKLSHQAKGYKIFLILGWATTLLAAAGYILLTRKYETGPYEIFDLLTFTFSNGILEQFMFIFWFLLGCYIGKITAPNNPKLIFISGYLVYAVFSG